MTWQATKRIPGRACSRRMGFERRLPDRRPRRIPMEALYTAHTAALSLRPTAGTAVSVRRRRGRNPGGRHTQPSLLTACSMSTGYDNETLTMRTDNDDPRQPCFRLSTSFRVLLRGPGGRRCPPRATTDPVSMLTEQRMKSMALTFPCRHC